MIKRNKRDLNMLFNKPLAVAAQPDKFWTLPNEMIGFELEVENFGNKAAAAQQLYPEWHEKVDMSLRGGFEWVLNGPHSGAKLRVAIDKLFPEKMFKYDMSERTSTHVHINMSDGLDLEQLRTMTALVYVIEPAIFRWADENRKWCSYCCPLSDMAPERLAAIFNEEDDNRLIRAINGVTHEDKYYGFNLVSFIKHGTVEFRYFPCTNLKQDAINWIQFVMEVKKAALQYDGLAALFAELNSPDKINGFMARHFPLTSQYLLGGLDVADAVRRVEYLEALSDVNPREVLGSNGCVVKINNEGKAFKKMLKELFKYDPAVAVQAKAARAVDVDGLKAEERRRQYNYWDAKLRDNAMPHIADQIRILRDQFA